MVFGLKDIKIVGRQKITKQNTVLQGISVILYTTGFKIHETSSTVIMELHDPIHTFLDQ